MPDGKNSAVQSVKRAVLETVDASKPVNVLFGTVISDSPLKINVDQKMILGVKQLILTRNVTDFTVNMTVDHKTELETAHTHEYFDSDTGTGASGSSNRTTEPTQHLHAYKGTKAFRVHNALKAGETVVLIRLQGGKKFLVIDRLGV